MENRGKKTIRSNKAQIAYLCQYMAQHNDFTAGDYRTPLGASCNNAQWAKLKDALDELGPQRSLEQWKVCWRDQKRKAREESGALNKARNTTGNLVSVPELSDNSVLVLSAIGQEMAVGCGPEESPIGFIPETTTPLPARAPSPFVAPSPSGMTQAVEPSTSGMENQASVRRPPAPPRRRARRSLPPDRFLNAQAEMNSLLKEIIEEIRRGNKIKEKHLEEIRRGNKLKEQHLNFLPTCGSYDKS